MEQTKVAVITGATGGIGASVALALSRAGYGLVLSGRSEQKLIAVAPQLEGESAFVEGDLREPDTPASLRPAARDRFGRCDACLNNAGAIEVGRIEEIDIERVCDMVRLNVEATFRVASTFLKHFAAHDVGHLVNMSSVLGKKVRATAGAYAGTKFAIEALSEALRMELSHTNVMISNIQPGLVMSGLHDRWHVYPSQAMGILHPLQPEDVARTVVFVAPATRAPQNSATHDPPEGS